MDDKLKLAILEQYFMNRRLKCGDDVAKLPVYIQTAMLDVMGKTLFPNEWTIADKEIEHEL